MEWQELIVNNLGILNNPAKKNWQPEEMAIVYKIVNGHDGTNLKDTGCGMCRRSTVTRCRRIVETYLKTLHTN